MALSVGEQAIEPSGRISEGKLELQKLLKIFLDKDQKHFSVGEELSLSILSGRSPKQGVFHRRVSGTREVRHIRLAPGLLQKLLKREGNLSLGSESPRHRGDQLFEHGVRRDTLRFLEELEHCSYGPQRERLSFHMPMDTGLQFRDVVNGQSDMARGRDWLIQEAREVLIKYESFVVIRSVAKPISASKRRTFSSRPRPFKLLADFLRQDFILSKSNKKILGSWPEEGPQMSSQGMESSVEEEEESGFAQGKKPVTRETTS